MSTTKLKQKVAALEAKLQASEEENKILRDLNEIFRDENDKLLSENETLKKETAKFKQFRFPSSILTRQENRQENIVGRKRSKSCPTSTEAEGTDEEDAVKARVNFLSVNEFLLNINRTNINLLFIYYLDRNEALIKGPNSKRIPIRL